MAKDAVASKWVEQGLELHDNKRSTVCLFCGNKISDERLNALRSHFNRSYRELSDKIDKAIELLNEKERQFDSAKQSLPNWGLLYKEFQQEYQNCFEKAVELCDKYILIIHGIVDILKKKKSDMINETLTDQFTTLISQLSFDYTIFDEISKIIEEHNKKTQEFQESIQKAQKAVELHHVSSYADELTSLEEKISKKKDELDEQVKIFDKQNKQIEFLEQDVRNSQIPADEINRDIAFIMGRDELNFVNRESGYRITRNGKTAKNLSKGEENAIALIYFFNTIHYNCVGVIDIPNILPIPNTEVAVNTRKGVVVNYAPNTVAV